MKRAAFAIVIGGLASVAVCGTSNASPIAPLPAGAMDNNNVVQAYYWHRHYYPYHWHHHYYLHRHWYHGHYRYW